MKKIEKKIKAFLLTGLRKYTKLLAGYGLGSMTPIKQIKNLLIRFLKPDYVTIQGRKIIIDRLDGLSLSLHQMHEPATTAIMREHVHKGDRVADLGANIGYFTVILADLVGETGKVYSFEPERRNFELIKRNVEINEFGNVVLEQAAVSDYSGFTKLNIAGSTTGHNIHSSETEDSVEIKVISLDDYFGNNAKIDFIKMDIQGAEGLALKKMADIIRRNPAMKIVTEFCPEELKKCGTEPENFVDDLLGLGFTLFNVNNDLKKISIEPIEKDALLANLRVDEHYCTDLLCIRE